MNYNKFQILEFKLENMVVDPSIVMIAKRGSGKSWISRDIVYNYRHIPGGLVIAPTDRMNPVYKMFFPDLYIHYNITPILLKKILVRQSMMRDKEQQKRKEGKKINAAAILVMDDCLSRKGSWAKDESILEILMNGRHYKLTYILTMQSPLGITPELRLNFDYIFLLKEDAAVNKKKLYLNYASMFPTLTIFEQVLAKCTEDYKSMVIDNRKPSDNLQEKVFWYKASNRKFSFGSKEFKDLHKKYFDPNYAKRLNAKLLGLDEFGCRKKKNASEIGIVLK